MLDKPKRTSSMNDFTKSQVNFHKFVMTGGPCAGKTTAIARLQAFLSERGFRVFVAPEAATILFLVRASPLLRD